MTAFDEHFDSARRHFGVALIDLNYAAADLARSVVGPERKGGASAAFELLNREISRLKELSVLIDEIADFKFEGDGETARLQRWWPHLVRDRTAHEESTPD